MSKLLVKKVAVLGAGVMGAQIAAHFANCNHEVVLYDLPGRSIGALNLLTKLKPSPLVTKSVLNRITACDYDNDLEYLRDCEWIVEAVAEDMAIKIDLYNKVKDYISPSALFTTNTSGLSINNLAEVLVDSKHDLQARFLGVHFFNPPRYQSLLELVPHEKTDPKVLDSIEEYATRFLGKGIVRAKDTPNFVANRVGVFSMLVSMHYAEKYHLGFDTVDALTGQLIGRPKSGTFRTADVVGLDTLSSVINTMNQNCTNDPWHEYLKTPDYLQELIKNKCLGQKTKRGFYYKDNKEIKVLDLKTKEYVTADAKGAKLDPKLVDILKIRSVPEKFKLLREYEHPQAKFLWACYRDVWHYCAYHLASIADTTRDIDQAIKWGFGWQQGPFEIWQAAGWKEVAALINEDRTNNQALSKEELPSWVGEIDKPYSPKGAYSFSQSDYMPSSKLKVYNRQLDVVNNPNLAQKILLENDSAKLWAIDSKSTAIFSLKTKMNVINTESLELLDKAIDYINNDAEYTSMVIWQDRGDNFSAGADLKGFVSCMQEQDYSTMNNALKLFQTVNQKLRHADFPVVAGVKGLALGGGCELLLHCDKVVAAIESYIGLVEVGVGLVPAGGGCKEMVLRANQYYEKLLEQKLVTSPDKLLETYYKNIAMAEVSISAQDALDKGYLKVTDIIIANSAELLYVSLEIANSMEQANYKPPIKQPVRVSGQRLKANLFALLANFKQGNFISTHDYLIASKIAGIVSGGDVDTDSMVTEEWLLRLEREAFIALLKTDKTQERVNYMLTKGKPLRN